MQQEKPYFGAQPRSPRSSGGVNAGSHRGPSSVHSMSAPVLLKEEKESREEARSSLNSARRRRDVPSVHSTSSLTSNSFLDMEEEVLPVFDARTNYVFGMVKSPLGVGLFVFLVLCWLYGVGILTGLCIEASLLILGGRFCGLVPDEVFFFLSPSILTSV